MNSAVINAERRAKRQQRRSDRETLIVHVLDAKAEFDRTIMRDPTLSDEDRWYAWLAFLRHWQLTLKALP